MRTRLASTCRWVLILAFAGVLSGFSQCPPQITEEHLLAFREGSLTIIGKNFVAPNTSERELVLSNGVTSFSFLDSEVTSWSPTQIVLTLPAEVDSTYQARVRIGQAWTNSVPLEVYSYDSYGLGMGNTSAFPLDVAFAPDGKPWVVGEFDFKIYSIDFSGTGIVASHNPPIAAGGIFRLAFPGSGCQAIPCNQLPSPGCDCFQSSRSALGEKILTAGGEIWFTQGGGYLYGGAALNASRVVAYNPAADTWRCFNVPINNAEAMGLARDPGNGDMYVTSIVDPDNLGSPVILRFRPEEFDPSTQASCSYDFTPPYPVELCGAVETEPCFKRFPIPNGPPILPTHIGHLWFDATDHGIWFTDMFLGHLGFLDLQSGAPTVYPLPANQRTRDFPNWPFDGSVFDASPGPWQLLRHGNIVWVAQHFEASVVAFDTDKLTTEDCTMLQEDLEGNETNPCVTDYAPAELAFVHSVAADAGGNVWFSFGDQLGRVTPTGRLEQLPSQPNMGGGVNGVAVSPVDGTICFGEKGSKSVGCIRLE